MHRDTLPTTKGKGKTLSFKLERSKVEFDCLHGSVVVMPQKVAGVDPIGIDSNGNPIFIQHKLMESTQALLLGVISCD
jgi:hypothetical protein